MKIPGICCSVAPSIHGEGGRNVHKANLLDTLGVIETKPVRDTRAAIMSRDQEALVAVVTHHINLVLRHGAKRIVLVPFSVLRFTGIAVTAEIGHVDREVLRQLRRYFVPCDMRFRVTVQQQ